MTYLIEILPSARKSLASLPKRDRARVDKRILALAENPRPPAALPLKGAGRGLWRVRVGDYRILYEIQDTRLIVVIVDIGNRRDVYRGL
jgi:mRNA interferase RelE/StbE